MTKSESHVLLTTAHVRTWEEAIARLTAEIDERVVAREKYEAKLGVVRELLADLPPEVEIETVVKQPRRQGKFTRGPRGSTTWMSEISRILAEEIDGVTYPDLRAGIDLGPLSARMKKSDKGLYGAVGKLEASGELVKYNGRLFSPASLAGFKARVLAGLVQDIPPTAGAERPSPMGDAIMQFIRSNWTVGVESGEVVQYLKTLPAFEQTVTKNKTAAYNVVKRLLDRGRIQKKGVKYFPLKENEDPWVSTGSSETSEGANPR